MKAAIYGRVSTTQQDYTRQVEELRAYAARQEWDVVEYLEKESAKIGSVRPALKQLLADARLKKIDVVVVSKIDRFGRSIKEFIDNIMELDRLRVRFIAIESGIDTDQRNPLANLFMHLLMIFAEFELAMIHDRTKGGLDQYRKDYAAGRVGENRARRSKTKMDLPVGRPRKIRSRTKMLNLREQGMSIRQIAGELKVPRSSVDRALREMAA